MTVRFSTLAVGNDQSVTEPRAEPEGDRRVAAVAAAVVLLALVVAAIVTLAAMAYRDDGKGGLLGTKAGSSWTAKAPAFEPKNLTGAPTTAPG